MILRAENLAKNIQRSVVKGISVEVNQGEIVSWLGDSNGAGKTTSLYDCGLVKQIQVTSTLDLDITDIPRTKSAARN
jgi:lipopolysaccharide export system ATP-binding protein